MKEDVKVSICCITYNQEQYIEDAIKSFLMQKTNFKFEIIIRDDASTDNTAKIIKKYEKKYPDIIKPIYEKTNGTLKGIKRPFNVTFESAVGKYIALCEGDDYWCDIYKLQKQYDYMEQNKECSLYVHNANKLNMKNNKLSVYKNKRDFYFLKDYKENIYDAGHMMLIGLCGKFVTASMFFRKKDVLNCPQFYFDAPCGDMPLKMITTNKGYMYYDNQIMSVYRYNQGNSAMDKWERESKEKHILRNKKFIKLINEFNKYSNYKYECELEKVKIGYEISILLIKNEYKDILKNKDYRHIYRILHSDYFFIKLFLKKYFSGVVRLIKNKRGKIG